MMAISRRPSTRLIPGTFRPVLGQLDAPPFGRYDRHVLLTDEAEADGGAINL
jgi:hypothetical protein